MNPEDADGLGPGFYAAMAWAPDAACEVVNDVVPVDGSDPSGPWLVFPPDAEGAMYSVLRRPGLLADFDRVAADPAPSRIAELAGRYGVLDGGQRVESGEQLVTAERISVWQSELVAFGELRAMWQAIQVRRRDPRQNKPREDHEARSLLSRHISWSAVSFRYRIAGRSGGLRLPAQLKRGDTVAAASYVVHQEVNRRLHGQVSPAVLPFRDSELRMVPHNLLAAIYVAFAFDLAGRRREERECEYCRAIFPATNQRQRFCSESCRAAAGYRRRKGES